MYRYFFKISYDGTPYFGWQKQPKQISIQETIEKDTCAVFISKPFKLSYLFERLNGLLEHAEQSLQN